VRRCRRSRPIRRRSRPPSLAPNRQGCTAPRPRCRPSAGQPARFLRRDRESGAPGP
jgi:hypothetical protein